MPEPITLLSLASVALFLIGLLGGWMIARTRNKNPITLQIVVGTLVTIVWVVTIAAGIVIPEYSVSYLIHGIMGGVVGYLFSEEGLNINLGNKEE